MSDRRVVITGLGVVSPLGDTVPEFWRAILAGQSGIRPIARLDVSQFDCRIGGEAVAFDNNKHFDSHESKRIDRFAQFALVAAKAAVEDSGLDFAREDLYACGVLLGSGIGGLQEVETQVQRLTEKGPSRVSAFLVPKLMINAASGLVSIKYGLRGPNSAVASACASATNAMGDTFKIIQRGAADVMITGGAEAALTQIGLAGFCSMKALSLRNDDPTHASRPFDRDRDGFIMGEGAGLCVFEEYEHARKRGARIYAEVVGYGMAGDGNHITAPEPEGRGAAAAMNQALKDARLNPSDVNYINAHGTSTSLGDAAEVKAIKSVFGPAAYKLAISSTKSFVGHLLGASGGVEMVATLMGLRDQVAHATANLDNPDEGFDLNFVPKTAQPMKIDVAMSNSFGFGGHNAVVIVKRV